MLIACQICGAGIEVRVRPGPRQLYCGPKCRRRAESLRRIDAELAEPEKFAGRHEWLRTRRAVLANHVTGEIRVVAFKRSRHDGRYRPATTPMSSFTAHVSVETGQLVERADHGWRVVAEPPDIDVEAVLTFLAKEAR